MIYLRISYKFLLISFFFINISYSSELNYLNNFQLTSEKNFLHGYSTLNQNGLYNAVIEIPAGTNEKWEVSKNGKLIELELKNSQPRIIDYLPYPTNYGFIPKTYFSDNINGDNGPLDILVLSQKPIKRGEIVSVYVIGMIKMKDKGSDDHKIISILPDSKFSKVKSIDQLNEYYQGLLNIINIWFSNYKGEKIIIEGYGGKKEAKRLIKKTKEFYEKR